MVQVIATEKAPQAVGPYSQAVSANGMTFVSGQIPIEPASGKLLTGSITEQTKQVLENISSILKAANLDLSKVVKTTVYLKDMADFDEMNQTYGQYFPGHKPARATVQVAKLPKDAQVEIDAIAIG